MFYVVADGCHFLFQRAQLLLHRLHVEFGYLSYRLLDQFQYILHQYVAFQQGTEFVHTGEYVLQLLLPAAGFVVLQQLVNLVLEENLLERAAVPVVPEFVQAYLLLLEQQVAGMEGGIAQDVVHSQELRLVVHYDAGVRGNGHLAVGEGVERVDGLVRGNVVRQVYDYLRVPGGKVVYLAYLDLALFLGLHDALAEHSRSLAVRNLGNLYGVLVDLLYPGPDLDHSAPLASVVFAAVCEASGREVRVDFELLVLKYAYRSVEQFIEIVGEYLRGESHGNALGSLFQKQRELHRKFDRFVELSVVGLHKVGGLGIEHHLLGELRQAALYVSACCVRVACNDISPVSLSVYEKILLAELYERAEYGHISVRVIGHHLSYRLRRLGAAAVVVDVHRLKHPALNGLETVHKMRDGPLQYHIRRIVEEPFFEHPRQFVASAALVQQFAEPALFRVGNDLVFFVFAHFFSRIRIRTS